MAPLLIVGALAISGFPLTSGFTTKTLISQAAIDENLAVVYFLLAAASAGVFLHAGIKFPWFVFFQKDSGLRPKDAPWNMAAAMVLFSALCILIGVFPQFFYGFLPYPVDYQAYEPGKVLFYLQLLLFSGLAFFLLLPLMKRTLTISLDTDWLWRVPGFNLANKIFEGAGRLGKSLETAVKYTGSTVVLRLLDRRAGGLHLFSRSQPIATTALWIALLLTAYVLTYFF
jgi:multicomponent Na+:H+ antiporter subunit D